MPQAKVVFSKQEATAIRRQYDAGETLMSLSREWGYVPPLMRRAILQAGGKVRKPGRRKGQKEKPKRAKRAKRSKVARVTHARPKRRKASRRRAA